MRLVVFTDLDGSLLDQETYSYENARAALPFIRRVPGLDFAVRLDLDYRPLAEIVAAKIRFTET